MRDKTDLRKELRKSREQISQDEFDKKSLLISDKFMAAIDLSNKKTAHIYNSVDSLKEVDTKPLIKLIRKRYPDIVIETSPVYKSAEIPSNKFDLIIVPVLGFDKDNYRLGMGEAWYDRFLAGQTKALWIGLSYQSGFVPEGIPHELHDIPLDEILTEI